MICTGGEGIPTMCAAERKLQGVEVVIDKDLASGLLAREIAVDLFISATDADAVFLDWDTPDSRGIKRASPQDMAGFDFAAGSMGPKVEAACQFARETGKLDAIDALADLEYIVAGRRGTTVLEANEGVVLHDA